MRHVTVLAVALAALAAPAAAAPTRSRPIAVAPDGAVFVVNPDSNSVARLVFGESAALVEAPVGRYPRTLALAGAWVFTADQSSDTVSRRDQADLGSLQQVDLGFGCGPYGIAPTPAGDRLVVSCQGTSTVVILGTDLAEQARIPLAWPNARAIAVTADGARAYVTHFLTEEPGTDGHVSVLDLAAARVTTVFPVPADATTCETQNSGQGVLNLLSAIAVVPAGPLAGQVWVGGTQQNNVSKGLFKRFPPFAAEAGAALFPLAEYEPFPGPVETKKRKRRKRKEMSLDASVSRNKYKASFHDVTRFGIVKLDGATGAVVGKIDVDEANHATDIEFSADGTVAYVVDQMFNSYHLFNTRKGQDGDVTTLFASPSTHGPGGVDPAARCVPEALRSVSSEAPFRMAPQAQISPIEGHDPFDASLTPVNTGVDFDAATYMTTDPPVARMRPVPDGVGTAPIGVALSPDGETAYVANYLARNVVPVATALPLGAGGLPANLRCLTAPSQPCATNNDCPAGGGFCNHPGGAACAVDADCGDLGPCVISNDCVPLIVGEPQWSIAGGIDADPLPPSLLDGKILFNTAARDSSVPNVIGLQRAAPLFNDPALTGKLPGSVVSTAHDASYVSCTACHADFGGQDGRTWDFSQFGASLRNTMDLRGRAGFAPGFCSDDPGRECFFDAACGAGNACRMRDDLIPPNIPAEDRDRYFNPMLTVHWNGDRDEVEDFEHTYRQLMGAGDCDGLEDVQDAADRGGCMGALVQRSAFTSTDPVDVNPDLGAPNRNLRGKLDPSKNVGVRLSNMADFVYSLTEFVRNPNQPDAAAERGRRLFNDPQVRCAECHAGGPGPGRQFFTDKRPKRVGLDDFDPSQPAGADRNNPFLRHDVGTANLFDRTDPLTVARRTESYQNERMPIPGSRGVLGDYVTPVLNDVWNTAPYLHDGSAPTLLDVVRPCDSTLDDCEVAGRGRNVDERHGGTSFLTPRQLNDLAAFQKTLTLATVVGNGDRVVEAGRLALRRVTLAFGKRGGSFAVAGTLSASPRPLDPSAGLVLTLATPAGQEMAIVSRQLALTAKGRRLVGRDGGVQVTLRDLGGGELRLSAKGKRLDLSALDTGNRDLTVALEVGGVQFAKNRNLTGRKRVFRAAKRRT